MAITRHFSPSGTPATTRWAVTGALCGGLLTLAFFAPAAWLAQAASRLTGEQLQLPEARGTLWKGQAGLVLTGGPGSRDAMALPGGIEWTLRPGWDGLRTRLSAPCCNREPLELVTRLRWGGFQTDLAPGTSEWPAALLAGLGTPWNTVQVQGSLRLSTTGLSMSWLSGRFTLAGSAQLDARQMSSRLSTVKPMGSYRLTLSGGSVPSLKLETREGPLQLSGQGEWVGARLRFQGVATAAPEREEALSNLLNIIGRRQGARSVITAG